MLLLLVSDFLKIKSQKKVFRNYKPPVYIHGYATLEGEVVYGVLETNVPGSPAGFWNLPERTGNRS